MPPMEAELKHGKCQLCGEDDKDLWFFILGDYLGFTCHACMLQLEEMPDVFPKITGPLCAKMDRGLSGQDGFNGMVPVIRRDSEWSTGLTREYQNLYGGASQAT